jgi:hypothetical protein
MLPSIFFQICCLKSACLGSPNLRKSLAMAGFQLTLYGRFWVTPNDFGILKWDLPQVW